MFGQRVMERIGATADVAEPPVQPGWFKTLIFIYSDSHPVTERTLVRRIRRHWPRSRIVLRGGSHCGLANAMASCEENGVGYICGIAGNGVAALAH